MSIVFVLFFLIFTKCWADIFEHTRNWNMIQNAIYLLKHRLLWDCWIWILTESFVSLILPLTRLKMSSAACCLMDAPVSKRSRRTLVSNLRTNWEACVCWLCWSCQTSRVLLRNACSSVFSVCLSQMHSLHLVRIFFILQTCWSLQITEICILWAEPAIATSCCIVVRCFGKAVTHSLSHWCRSSLKHTACSQAAEWMASFVHKVTFSPDELYSAVPNDNTQSAMG